MMTVRTSAAMSKAVAVFAAIHVAVVLMTCADAMGPSGSVVKGRVPAIMPMQPESTLVVMPPAAPAMVERS
jgi:hypothetical protein